MASVRIDSGIIEADLPLREVPVKDWRLLVIKRRTFLDTKLDYDCRCLVQFVKEAEELCKKLPQFRDADHLIAEGYGLKPEEIRLAVRWLELNDPEEAIGLPDKQPMAKRQTMGKRIAALRVAAGLSQPQLAKRAGVPIGTLRNWEQDLRQPYASALQALAVALGVEVGPLLDGVTFPTQEKPGRAGRPRKVAPADVNETPTKKQPRKKKG